MESSRRDFLKLLPGGAAALYLGGKALLLGGCANEQKEENDNKYQEPGKTLADYPYLFQNENEYMNCSFVVGSKAPANDVVAAIDIASGMKAITGKPVKPANLDTEIDSLEQNLVLVGRNSAYAPGQENAWLDQIKYRDLKPGEGLIELQKRGDFYNLIVTGHDLMDVRRSGRVLQNALDYDLSGNKILVTGTSLDDITVQILE